MLKSMEDNPILDMAQFPLSKIAASSIASTFSQQIEKTEFVEDPFTPSFLPNRDVEFQHNSPPLQETFVEETRYTDHQPDSEELQADTTEQ